MAISKKTRFEIFKRDGFACQYCGKKPPDTLLECDHIQPLFEGGSDDYSNLITSCFECNRGKSCLPLGVSDCERVQQLQLETIAQLAAFNELLINADKARDRHVKWLSKKIASNLGWKRLAKDEENSLSRFARSLTYDRIVNASEKTATKKHGADPASAWRYFCGVCWGMIKDAKNGGIDGKE